MKKDTYLPRLLPRLNIQLSTTTTNKRHDSLHVGCGYQRRQNNISLYFEVVISLRILQGGHSGEIIVACQGFLKQTQRLSVHKTRRISSNYGQLCFLILFYDLIGAARPKMPLYSILWSWENLPLILEGVVIAVSSPHQFCLCQHTDVAYSTRYTA